jgi:hypothetical protein
MQGIKEADRLSGLLASLKFEETGCEFGQPALISPQHQVNEAVTEAF